MTNKKNKGTVTLTS